MKETIINLSIWAIIGTLLTPILEMIGKLFYTNFGLFLIVIVLITGDTLMGIGIALLNKKASSSTFFNKFFTKILAYLILLILCFSLFILTQTSDMYHMDLEAAKIIITYPMSIIIAREAWSLFEGVNILQPKLAKNFIELFKKVLKK